MTDYLHLREQDKQQLLLLRKQYLADVDVWAYGSRVNGKSHEGSDLDLVLRTSNLTPIDSNKLARFKQALQESNIPILIDAKDWALLPESFHTEINKKYVVLVGEVFD